MFSLELFFFFFFTSIAFASAILVIRSKNAIHSVLFLILVFINMTGLLLLSKVDFLAIMLIIIYVGAIAILFLFVVMMLNIPILNQNIDEKLEYLPISLFIGFIFFFETFFLFKEIYITKPIIFNNYEYYIWVSFLDNTMNTQTLGQILYTYYAFYFLLAGFILLIALIGAVVLTLRQKKVKNQQELYKQLSRNCKYAIFNIKK